MENAAERLFLAVALADELRDALASHLERAGGPALPGRVVPAASWHLTLRFLGDTPPLARAAVLREVEGAVLGPPFALGLGGWGAFPDARRARVLWLGVREGVEPLRRLAERVETAVVAAGFPRERRPFAAHLTLSRLRDPADVRPLLAALPPFSGRAPVNEVTLFHSELGRGPARYTPLARFPLR